MHEMAGRRGSQQDCNECRMQDPDNCRFPKPVSGVACAVRLPAGAEGEASGLHCNGFKGHCQHESLQCGNCRWLAHRFGLCAGWLWGPVCEPANGPAASQQSSYLVRISLPCFVLRRVYRSAPCTISTLPVGPNSAPLSTLAVLCPERLSDVRCASVWMFDGVSAMVPNDPWVEKSPVKGEIKFVFT